jgi:microcystin-dependent protein
LFAVIGTSFGVGDGSTTFNVPNFKGRFPVGVDSSVAAFDTLAETGGSRNAVVPSHNHTASTANDMHDHFFSVTSGTDTHNHTGTDPDYAKIEGSAAPYLQPAGSGTSYVKGAPVTDSDTHSHSVSGTTWADTHNHAVTVDNFGVSATNANLPPYIAVNYIVRAA